MGAEVSSGSEASLSGDVSFEILARINEREQEIERILLEARDTAAAILQEARSKAEAISSVHREQVEREAATAAESIVAQAHSEAKEILAAGSREAAEILETPRERIEAAAQRLLGLILPGTATGQRP